MPLDRKVTQAETTQLVEDLHNLSILFRDRPMSKDQLREYVRDLSSHYDFTYSFEKLRDAIRLARQSFTDPGEHIPKPRYIMDRIKPYRQG
jgi:hypothetical protein